MAFGQEKCKRHEDFFCCTGTTMGILSVSAAVLMLAVLRVWRCECGAVAHRKVVLEVLDR